jgi:hypothetical protein
MSYYLEAPIDRLGLSLARMGTAELCFLGTDSGAVVEVDDQSHAWVATCRDENVADFLVQAHRTLPHLFAELKSLRLLVTEVSAVLNEDDGDAEAREKAQALLNRFQRSAAEDAQSPVTDARAIVALLKSQIGRYLDVLDKVAAGANQNHPDWGHGLLEAAIDEANGLLSLRDYVVTVLELEDGATEVLFRCQAEDRDHAAEMAGAAHPDGEVVNIQRMGPEVEPEDGLRMTPPVNKGHNAGIPPSDR